VYRLVTGVIPFSPAPLPLIEYCKDKMSFPNDPLASSGFKQESSCSSFIHELLATEPKERPSATLALHHAWIISGGFGNTLSCFNFSMLTEFLRGPNAGEFPEDFPQSNEEILGVSEPSLSTIAYNTSTHEGLKSSGLPSPSNANSSYTDSVLHSRASHVANVFTMVVSNELAIRRKPLSIPPITKPDISTTHILLGHKGPVTSVAFSPDGREVASGSADETVQLWDSATGQPGQTLKWDNDRVWCVAFSPDGKLLASGSEDKIVRLWAIALQLRATRWRMLKGHTHSVRSVVFSPDSKVVASASTDKTIRIWDVLTGSLLKVLNGHTAWVRSVAFSPNGQILASGSEDQTIRLWNPTAERAPQMLKGHNAWIWFVIFSPDGKILASASEDQTIRLWNIATGVTLQTLNGHTRPVRSLAFVPNGKILASASEDGTIRLWDIATSSFKALTDHRGWVNWVTFSGDGKVLASASVDNTIRLWDVATIDFTLDE
jgi:WD40 repeat protein